MTFNNPVIPGFYPDPSVCRVGDDYYLVASTFEYYPGVPIFTSKDLVHWQQIGHVLDRPSQLNLQGVPCSKGIYAATIRYHEGLFYVVTTFVESKEGKRRNFYVTAEDPAGSWSEPIWLEDAPGIDPSLFFDDDGKVYYTGNRPPPAGPEYPKHVEIWMQELDLEKQQLVGERVSLWDGALKQIHAQEGPRQFKRNGYYYLMIAEGGTGFTHSVTIARSQTIEGPYEVCKHNPILTHRHLGSSHPITNVGHGELVETQTGEWWMFCLGSRPYGGYYRNLGRETFLAPVVWENDWPVVCPGQGKIDFVMKRPQLAVKRWDSTPACDHFSGPQLRDEWMMIRTPNETSFSLTERPGYLRLYGRKERISEAVHPSFIGRRQQHQRFAVATKIDFKPEHSEEAGIVLFQDTDHHYRFVKRWEDGKEKVCLFQRDRGVETMIAAQHLSEQIFYLKVEAHGQEYRFSVGFGTEQWVTVAEKVDGRILSIDHAGGFTGAVIGMYCSSNGDSSNQTADFEWFEYQSIE
ncbi:glycoside hydrolase family 43 protein [Salipaludibacillus sp. CF4.18]|uniref:glycoside hydrolase family 43 protein n=1 Tax=Salipaludibacillus sp. CF4.18 TaxID=3373081 RepID=UPI003EE6F74A